MRICKGCGYHNHAKAVRCSMPHRRVLNLGEHRRRVNRAKRFAMKLAAFASMPVSR